MTISLDSLQETPSSPQGVWLHQFGENGLGTAGFLGECVWHLVWSECKRIGVINWIWVLSRSVAKFLRT